MRRPIRRSRFRSSEKGLGKYTVIFFGTIFGITAYLAYQILPFYYYYYELQAHFDQIVRVASAETEESIRKKLGDHMKWMEIPADINDVNISRGPKSVQLSLSYSEYFDVPFADYFDVPFIEETWEFPFEVYSEGSW